MPALIAPAPKHVRMHHVDHPRFCSICGFGYGWDEENADAWERTVLSFSTSATEKAPPTLRDLLREPPVSISKGEELVTTIDEKGVSTEVWFSWPGYKTSTYAIPHRHTDGTPITRQQFAQTLASRAAGYLRHASVQHQNACPSMEAARLCTVSAYRLRPVPVHRPLRCPAPVYPSPLRPVPVYQSLGRLASDSERMAMSGDIDLWDVQLRSVVEVHLPAGTVYHARFGRADMEPAVVPFLPSEY